MFVLDPSGAGLLLTGSFKTLGDANWGSIALVTFTAAVGIVALRGGFQGWLFKKTTLLRALDAARRRRPAGLSEDACSTPSASASSLLCWPRSSW